MPCLKLAASTGETCSMKKAILLLFFLISLFAKGQILDTIASSNKFKKHFPGITLGYNHTGFHSAEAGFVFFLINNSNKETNMFSMILHGPSVGCQLGNYLSAFRVAPRISYEYYTTFIGGRISLVDYMDDDIHSFYLSPEAGISFGSTLNLFAGASIPISDNSISDVSAFRLTAAVNLLFFYFGKDKKKN